MAGPNFPAALTLSTWEKQTKALKKSTTLGIIANALKALAKGHDAAGFAQVDAAKGVAIDGAEALLAKVGAAVKSIASLAADAKALEALARKLESDLKKEKQSADAATALIKAAVSYASEMKSAEAAAQSMLGELTKKVAESNAAAKAQKSAGKDGAPTDPVLVKLAQRIKGRTLSACKAVSRPGAAPMPFVLAIGPKHCLLSMGPSVAASEKTQLMKLVTEDGTRYHPGTCTYDKKANVFVFAGATLPAGGGLGTRLQKSLGTQLGKKMRVRLMRPDGTSEEGEPVEAVDGFDDVTEDTGLADDGVVLQLDAVVERLTALNAEATPAAAEVAKRVAAARDALAAGDDTAALKAIAFLEVVAERLAAPRPGATAPDAVPAAENVPSAPPLPPPAPQARAARLAERLKKLQNLFVNAPVMKTDAGTQIQSRLDAAAKALEDGEADAAKEQLDALDQVAQRMSTKAPAAATGAKVVFTQSRLRWDGARKKVQAELRKLEEAIVAAAQGEPDLDDITATARGVYRVLEHLDEALIDRLDEAYSAADPAAEATAREAARQLITRYRSFVDGDPLMIAIDDSPFGKVDVRGSVLDALTDLQSKLAA